MIITHYLSFCCFLSTKTVNFNCCQFDELPLRGAFLLAWVCTVRACPWCRVLVSSTCRWASLVGRERRRVAMRTGTIGPPTPANILIAYCKRDTKYGQKIIGLYQWIVLSTIMQGRGVDPGGQGAVAPPPPPPQWKYCSGANIVLGQTSFCPPPPPPQ